MKIRLQTNVRFRIVHSPILSLVVSAMASTAQGEYSVFTILVRRKRIMMRIYIRTLVYMQNRCNAFTFEGFGSIENAREPQRFNILGTFDATRPTNNIGYIKIISMVR